MKRLWCVWIVAFLACTGIAQTRRALIVGIDKYMPPKGAAESGIDLGGCINDTEAMRQVLVARWGYESANVAMLQNFAATRAAILTALEKLAADTKEGDVSMFYYSGHGSQVKNLETDEYDGMDETIVPADRLVNEGGDIRDKELAVIYQKIASKGAQLIVVYDSCHSGSAARGIFDEGKAKTVAPLKMAVKDARKFDLSKLNVLVVSAAREFEPARENPYRQPVRAAFSGALTDVLQTADINSSASAVFEMARAMMKAEGKFPQEPVLECSADRRLKGFLGNNVAGFSGKTRVAAITFKNDVAKLQGGIALGMRAGTELKKVSGKPVRLRVTDGATLTESSAKVIEGDPSDIMPGDFFEVEKWASPDEAYLKVWIPTSKKSAALIQQAAAEVAKLPPAMLVMDPKDKPTHVLSFGDSGWTLIDLSNGKATTLEKLNADGLKRAGATKTFPWFPMPAEMVHKVGLGVPGKTDNVAVVASPANAHYVLAGRPKGGAMEYAWTLPENFVPTPKSKALPAGQSISPVPLTALPQETDWSSSVADISEAAMKLARIRAWLTLPPPPDDGAFPYRVAFEATNTKNQYMLQLVCDPERLKSSIEPKYVYVFNIDSFGKSTLLAKRDDSPIPVKGAAPAAEISLGAIQFGEPFGSETFVLLATDKPLEDSSVLEFDGVQRSDKGLPNDPLSRLLSTTGMPTRSAAKSSSCDWRLYRVTVKSSASGLTFDAGKGIGANSKGIGANSKELPPRAGGGGGR